MKKKDPRIFFLVLAVAAAAAFVVFNSDFNAGGCRTDSDCADSMFCRFEACDSQRGMCAEVPDVCTAVYSPVCGCDGNTYSNECYMTMAKVSMLYDGDCARSQMQLPGSHMIDVQMYTGTDVSYKACTIMMLAHRGAGEWVVQGVLDNVGLPSEMFAAFKTYGLEDDVRIGYASGYSEEYAEAYDAFLADSSQVTVFGDQGEAFDHLKVLVSSDRPAMAILDSGLHHVLVTGYDEGGVYVNDPAAGKGFIGTVEFLERWGTVADNYDIQFPGRFGLVWF